MGRSLGERDGGGHGGKRSGWGSVFKADSVVLADGLHGGIAEGVLTETGKMERRCSYWNRKDGEKRVFRGKVKNSF